MGVTRLLKEVLDHKEQLSTRCPTAGQSFLVDASSFIFWVADRTRKAIAQQLNEVEEESWSAVLLNGLLVQFSEALCRQTIEAVLEEVAKKGIRLVFVFDLNVDVADDSLKTDTINERQRQRQKEYSEFLNKILENRNLQLPHDFLKGKYNHGLQVLKDVCQKKGVECINAPGEADWHLAFMFCHTQQFLAVVGRDTDFFVYRGCRCIMDFGELLEDEACVFSQEQLAEWLGFVLEDYDGFLDCMLLRGTDYTKHFLDASGVYARLQNRHNVQVQFISIRHLAGYVRDLRAQYHGNLFHGTRVFKRKNQAEAMALWERASEVYKLVKVAPEMEWTIQTLQLDPKQHWRVRLLQQALSGKISKRLAGLLAHHRFDIAPIFDPLGLANEKLTAHTRCCQLRRVLYRAIGLGQVREMKWGGVEDLFQLQEHQIELHDPQTNPWRLLELDQESAEAAPSELIREILQDELNLSDDEGLGLQGLLDEYNATGKDSSLLLACFFFTLESSRRQASRAGAFRSTDLARCWVRAFISAMLNPTTRSAREEEDVHLLRGLLDELSEHVQRVFRRTHVTVNVQLLLWSELAAFEEMLGLATTLCVDVWGAHRAQCSFNFTLFVTEFVKYFVGPDNQAPEDAANILSLIYRAPVGGPPDQSQEMRSIVVDDDDVGDGCGQVTDETSEVDAAAEAKQAKLDLFTDDHQGTVTEEAVLSMAPRKPAQHLNLAAVLPVHELREKIVHAIATNKVTVVQGDTGTGKSTQVPKYIIHNDPLARVVVIQPRRLAAVELARRVASELNSTLGDIVGFRIGGERSGSPRTRITFVTAGWMLQYLTHLSSDTKSRSFLFTHVVIDEAHERNVDADLVTMMMRRMLDASDRTLHSRAANVKLVLMSATIHAGKFIEYFGEITQSVAVVSIPSSHPFPIEHVYLEHLQDWLDAEGCQPLGAISSVAVKEAVGKQKKLVSSGRNAIIADSPLMSTKMPVLLAALSLRLVGFRENVLIFVGGFREIEAVAYQLNEWIAEMEAANVEIVMLHSQIDLPFQLQSLACTEAPVIFISTNLAESSLTLPNVTYVLDTGTGKTIQYDSRRHAAALKRSWVSQASARQRAGRTGRTGPGVAFHLYTTAFHDALAPYDTPELLRVPLDTTVLRIRYMDVGGSQELLGACMDAPDEDAIDRASTSLFDMGALADDDDEATLTNLGRVMVALPVEPARSVMVLLGLAFDCLEEAIVMAAYTSVQNPYAAIPRVMMDDVEEWNELCARKSKSRLEFAGSCGSDLIGCLSLYDVVCSKYDRARKCKRLGLVFGRVSQWIHATQRLADGLERVYPHLAERLAVLESGKVNFASRLRNDPRRVHILRVIILATQRDSLLEGMLVAQTTNKVAKKFAIFKADLDNEPLPPKTLEAKLNELHRGRVTRLSINPTKSNVLLVTVAQPGEQEAIVKAKAAEYAELAGDSGSVSDEDAEETEEANESEHLHAGILPFVQLDDYHPAVKFVLGLADNSSQFYMESTNQIVVEADDDTEPNETDSTKSKNSKPSGSKPSGRKSNSRKGSTLAGTHVFEHVWAMIPGATVKWLHEGRGVTISNDSEIQTRCDFTLGMRQQMFAVAADSIFAGTKLIAGRTTYLPYSPLTIAVMLMALRQHTHNTCSMLLRTQTASTGGPDCLGVHVRNSDLHTVVGTGLLPGTALQAVMDSVHVIRKQLSRCMADGARKRPAQSGAELTELIWHLILLTSAADVALDAPAALDAISGIWAKHELDPPENWVPEDAWSDIRIGNEVGCAHSQAFLLKRGTARLGETPKAIATLSQKIARGLQVELQASSPISGLARRLQDCALQLLE